MKVVWIVLKVLAVLAAVATVVYLVIAYGDKIKAWGVNLWNKITGRQSSICDYDCDIAQEDFAG